MAANGFQRPGPSMWASRLRRRPPGLVAAGVDPLSINNSPRPGDFANSFGQLPEWKRPLPSPTLPIYSISTNYALGSPSYSSHSPHSRLGTSTSHSLYTGNGISSVPQLQDRKFHVQAPLPRLGTPIFDLCRSSVPVGPSGQNFWALPP